MKTYRVIAGAALLIGAFCGRSHGVLSDSDPRAMGLAQAYTALVRGPESVFWNPANLGLSGNASFSWQLLNVGFTLISENNSFSVDTYNDYFTASNKNVSPRGTPYYIGHEDKVGLLDDVPADGLKLDVEMEPLLALGLPVNGGIAFPMRRGIQSALTIGFTSGIEGEVPKEMVELFLFGNDFAFERAETHPDSNYAISEWDGSSWAIASLNWAGAKAWMPAGLDPYLSEFAVGATLKLMGGMYGEIIDSGGKGLISRVRGAEVNSYLIAQHAGGIGFGIDVGAAGVTKNGKTTVSAGLLNLFDVFSWSIGARQDSLFVTADDLRITRVVDPDVENIEDVLDNEDVDGDGDADFHKQLDDASFSRSLPAVLRVGVAHEFSPRLTLAGNYDQAFTTGFGLSTTPRLAGGVEYRLVPWFPVRFGLSVGGRRSNSSAVGFALGPFTTSRMQFQLLDLALVTRSGFFPGISKGSAITLQLFKLSLI